MHDISAGHNYETIGDCSIDVRVGDNKKLAISLEKGSLVHIEGIIEQVNRQVVFYISFRQDVQPIKVSYPVGLFLHYFKHTS